MVNIYGESMVNIWLIYGWYNVYLGKFNHDLNQGPKPIDDGECKVTYPAYPLYGLLWD